MAAWAPVLVQSWMFLTAGRQAARPTYLDIKMLDDSMDAGSGGSGAGRANKTDALPEDFETALAQLEELVGKMENGSLPLEQSLAAYQRGVELTRICQKLLDSAEQQVKVLQGNLLKPLLDTSADEGEDDA